MKAYTCAEPNMKPLVVTILALFAMTAPAFAGGDDAAPKCREGIYGTWYPYENNNGFLDGIIKIEKTRIWFENYGGWIDMSQKTTESGDIFFVGKIFSIKRNTNNKDYYFTIFNPVKIDWFKDIPCAIDEVICDEESWIKVEIENKTGNYINSEYGIGEMYCSHEAYVPYRSLQKKD